MTRSTGTGGSRAWRSRPAWALGALLALLVVAVAAILIRWDGGGGDEVVAPVTTEPEPMRGPDAPRTESPPGDGSEVAPPPTGLPWLATAGNRIVVADTGEDVVLRGANLLRSEWDLRMAEERLAMSTLSQEWDGNVVVRGFASDPVLEGDAEYLALLDEHVALAAEHRMYVVFPWRSHEINGPQPDMPDERAQAALAALASRYHGVSHVMYALQVEPRNVSWEELQPRFVRMVDAIRDAASPHEPIVMVPGVRWSRDLSGAISQPVDRDNIVYKTHPYNDQSEFEEQFLDTYDAGLPVFIGEFGYLPDHDMEMDDVEALLDLADERGLSWAAWAFDPSGGPGLITDHETMAPTAPYGEVVRASMLGTPPVPGARPLGP